MASTTTKLSVAAAVAVAGAGALALNKGCAPDHYKNTFAELQPANSNFPPKTAEDVRHIAMSPHAGITSSNQIQSVAALGATAVPVLTSIIDDPGLPVNNRLFAVAAFGVAASKHPEVATSLMTFVSLKTNDATRATIIGDVTFTDGSYSVTNYAQLQNTNNITFSEFADRNPEAAVDKMLLASLANLPLTPQNVQFLTKLYDAFDIENARALTIPTSSLYNLPGVPFFMNKIHEYLQNDKIPFGADGMMHVSTLLFGTDERMLASITYAPKHSYVHLMVNNLVVAPYDPSEPSPYSNATYEKMLNLWLSTIKPPYISGKPEFDQTDYLNILMAVANQCRRTGQATINYSPAARDLITGAIKFMRASGFRDDDGIITKAERSLE